ncbi:MAG: hypothetical protein J6X22_04795 [Muribaculaceae bacterium]|nr:hypothetical protein [Muribaculaceae bacterium]
MKKIFLLLTILLSLGEIKAAVYGDVNSDGVVTAADVTAIYDVLLGNDYTFEATADVNNDNAVTAADITEVYDILLGNVTPEPKRGNIYICDNAGWGDMALYAWPDQGLNAWPGIHHSGTTDKDGKTYYRFDLSDGYYSRTLNYIANNYAAVNGGTSRQLDLMSDYTMGENDIYLTISGSAGNYSYVVDDDGTPPPVVYLHSELGWDDYCLYLWKNAAPVSASWPGEHYTSTKTIDNELWYVFELPKVYYTTSGTNWILNNNNNGKQYDLMQNFDYNQDIYVRVAADGAYTVQSTSGSGQSGGDVVVPTNVRPLDVSNTTALTSKNRVIYEMNVGSFTSAGTFTAAQAKLGDLRSLGIDIVWLMPIYPRGGGINSPYAATNFKATNSSYGTIAQLKSFVDRAHELGMEVILDWVPNHTATNAVWVTEHPEYYTTQNGEMVHPNNYGDVYQLNYDNPDLCEAMNDCLRFWIDQAGVDGYRCDYVSSPSIPGSYWASTIPMLRNYAAGKTLTMVAEADIVRDANKLLNVGFDYDYAWNFQSGKLERFGPNGTSATTLQGYCQSFINESQGRSFDRMTYLTNHDQNYNDGGKTLQKMYGANKYAFTTLYFTIYGMPLLYNGQEVGNDQILDYFHDTKINWNSTDAKMQNTIATLMALRHTQAALANGTTTTFLTSNNANVLAYTKTSGNSTVLVLMNLGNLDNTATVSGIPAGDYTQWLDSSTIAAGTTQSDVTLTASSTFALDAKGYRVFVKQ